MYINKKDHKRSISVLFYLFIYLFIASKIIIWHFKMMFKMCWISKIYNGSKDDKNFNSLNFVEKWKEKKKHFWPFWWRFIKTETF